MIDSILAELARRGYHQAADRVPPLGEWVRTIMTPTPQQAELLDLIERGETRIMVASGHGTGKTRIMAALAVWWLLAHDECLVITTAPTHRQLSDVLWGEIRRLWAGRPGIAPRAPTIRWGAREAVGITAAKPEALQGRHRPDTLVVIDEMVGLEADMWAALDSCAAGGGVIIAAGNPTSPGCHAHTVWQSGEYRTLTWSCVDHPNITGVGAHIEGAVAPDWVATMLRTWSTPAETGVAYGGQTWAITPPIASRVLGQWPERSTTSLFPPAWLEALSTPIEPEGEAILSVDPAGMGDDDTVLLLVQGGVVTHHQVLPGETSLSDIAIAAKRFDCSAIIYDSTGLGFGLSDLLSESIPFSASLKPRITQAKNARAEAYLALAKERVYIPDPALRSRIAEEAGATDVKVDDAGRVQVEPKARIRSKIGRSPDALDALAMWAWHKHRPWWAL